MSSGRRSPALVDWDRVTGAWVRFVRGGWDYYREYLNSPAMLRMIGPVRGLDVLDFGCGEGYHSRILARRGARVTGVDATPGMIRQAADEERRRPLGIRYLVRDGARLQGLRAGAFDLVACFMALMDFRDYRGAVREAARVLRPGGRFVFSVPHPGFDVVVRDGRMVSGWVRVGGKPHEGRALHFRVDEYFQTGLVEFEWTLRGTGGVTFTNRSWHLTLTDYVDALAASGFLVRGLVEPRPTKEGVRRYTGLAKVNRVPHSIVVECLKAGRRGRR